MNWKLIFSLSLLGLFMAIGSVFFIPEKVESWLWWVIVFINAIIIGRSAPGKYFGHGFMVSIVNCIWVTGCHILFYNTYEANHPQMIASMQKMPHYMHLHPRQAMLIVGPIVGIVFGIIIGFLSWIASMIFKPKKAMA